MLDSTLMNRTVLLCVFLLLTPATSFAQRTVKQETFDALAREFSGERAQEHIRAIVEFTVSRDRP